MIKPLRRERWRCRAFGKGARRNRAVGAREADTAAAEALAVGDRDSSIAHGWRGSLSRAGLVLHFRRAREARGSGRTLALLNVRDVGRCGAVHVHVDQHTCCFQKLDLLMLRNQQFRGICPCGIVFPPRHIRKLRREQLVKTYICLVKQLLCL